MFLGTVSIDLTVVGLWCSPVQSSPGLHLITWQRSSISSQDILFWKCFTSKPVIPSPFQDLIQTFLCMSVRHVLLFRGHRNVQEDGVVDSIGCYITRNLISVGHVALLGQWILQSYRGLDMWLCRRRKQGMHAKFCWGELLENVQLEDREVCF